MEEEVTQNPEEETVVSDPVVIEKKQSPAVLIFVGLAVVVVAIVLIFFVKNFLALKNTGDSGQSQGGYSDAEEKRIRDELSWTEQTTTNSSDSTFENANQFIRDLDIALEDPDASVTTKKVLTLRKALALSAVRGNSVGTDVIEEVTNLLNTLYTSPVGNEKEKHIKYAVIPAFINLLQSTCYVVTIGDMLPDPYDDLYRSYLDEGRNAKAALILAVREFAYEGIDPYYEDDIATVSMRAYLSAIYLLAFGQVKNPENEEILAELKEDLIKFGAPGGNERLTAKTLNGMMKSQVEPPYFQALAYDVGWSHWRTNIVKNPQIDEHYEDAFEAFTMLDETDLTSQAFLNVLNSINYLESIHRRYAASEIDTAKVDKLIDIFIQNVNYSKDVKGVFRGWLIEGQTLGGRWMPVRKGFLELAKNYPKLREYLEETAGIEL